MMVSLLSVSKCTLNVGSSRVKRLMPLENLSMSFCEGGKETDGWIKIRCSAYWELPCFVFFTLLAGFIDIEMTGSGTWIDSCRKSHKFLFYFGRHRKGDFHNKAENLFSHHGEVCAGFRCESVSASTVDPKQSTNVSCINFIYILEKKRHQGNQANDRVIF